MGGHILSVSMKVDNGSFGLGSFSGEKPTNKFSSIFRVEGDFFITEVVIFGLNVLDPVRIIEQGGAARD